VRKLIAGMKNSVDGKVEARTPAWPEGVADWVEAWSEDYGLTPQVDACLLGAGMYPGYETYWTALQNEPTTPMWITGLPPTPAELEWSRFISQTPHFVLSSMLSSAQWPNTKFLRGLDDVAALKQQPGKDIYLVGGARTVSSLIDAGLVDELRLITHPLIAGEGKSLFAGMERRRALELRKVERLKGGKISLIYGIS
jgi:dihydrofolate reductase